MRICIKRNPKVKQQWHFVIIAKNGRVLASSEKYLAKSKCLSAARKIVGCDNEWVIEKP